MKTAMGLLFAVAASALQAENLNTNVNLGGSATELSAAFGVTHHEMGYFVDTFTFTPSDGPLFVNASLVTLGYTPATDVNFFFANINGVDLTLYSPATFEYGYMLPTPITGPLVLTVIGTITGYDAVGPASASYSGTLNISPVPEPAGYALLLAGLGVAGAAGLGRRRQEE